MAANTWTCEENERFKHALKLFCAFSPTRFQSIAEYMQKPVVNVKEHYGEMVDDLLEFGSRRAWSDESTEAMVQSLTLVERTVWNKEEHEWFMVGLKRYETDWAKIADLLNSKNQLQVATYAYNYFHWQNSVKNVMKQSRANDITMVDLNMDPRGQQGSFAQPQSQRQHEPMVLDIGQNWKASSSKSYRT